MKAFQQIQEIEILSDIIEKHRAFLKLHQGLKYGRGIEGYYKKDEEWTKTKYYDNIFDTDINLIGRLGNQIRIEFDGNEHDAKQYLDQTQKKLEDNEWGFIRSTHKGKCDYLWIEFNRNLKDNEARAFLEWIAPEGSIIDLNFASSEKIFPCLYAPHWKHSYYRELPINIHIGNKIDIDSLGILKIKKSKQKEFKYEIYEKPKETIKLEIGEAREKLLECYNKLIYLHNHYLDWDMDEIKLQSLWDIATYRYKQFNTFPYKFITAMKSSGKTRLLKLTEAVCYKGLLTTGMTDSALFRSANDATLIFDEAETITRKEKQSQRIILNTGYKKGASVQVSKEKYVDKVKEFVVEKYEVFSPKMLANISGIEDVLGDRCIFSIMEKSANPSKVRLIEDFDQNPFFLELKRTLEQVSVVSSVVSSVVIHDDTQKPLLDKKVSVVMEKNIQEMWNSYIIKKYTTPLNIETTLNYTPTLTTLNYTKLHQTKLNDEELELCNKIDEAGLDGRNLELFFPLFIIAKEIGEEAFEDILRIAKNKVKSKKESEILESKDISVIDFVAKMPEEKAISFTPISDLTFAFKNFFENDEDNFDWLNSRWMGRALIRLNLITLKKRLGKGVEVILNLNKAKEKLKIFKVVDKEEVKE